jgi:hypothetical protein
VLDIPFESASGGDPDFPFKIGFGERFSMTVPEGIISSRPPPDDPAVPRYGLSYVFFAMCAGELRPDDSGVFPLACFADGEQVGSEGFIVGYTAVYSYSDEAIGNENPELTGVTFGEDEEPLDIACQGPDCSGVFPPPTDDPDDCGNVPRVPLCKDRDKCDEVKITPMVDMSTPAEPDSAVSAIRGEELGEQMWLNYYSDKGEWEHEVRLLNDALVGYNDILYGGYFATEPGLTNIWVVAHDNRGGVDWIRTQLCVEDE